MALGMEDLPFIGGKPASKIELAEKNKTLRKILEDELELQQKQNRQLQLYKSPHKIAQFERELLTKRLRAEGYYQTSIRSVTGDEGIIHKVDQGPLYTIGKLIWQLPEGVSRPDDLAIKVGDPLIAENILAIRSELERFIGNHYCFYRVKVNYDAVIYHKNNQAEVTYKLQDSPSTEFGQIAITGEETVDPDYLLDRLELKSGACFRRTALDAARLSLLQTNLLSSVEILEGKYSSDGIPITFRVTERNHRSISFGVGYRTEEGAGFSTGWQHRNLWGRAQQADLKLYVAQNRQALDGKLTIPHFHREDQTVTFFSTLEQEDTDAYKSKLASAGVSVSRDLGKHLRGDLGVQIDFSRIEEEEQLEDYALISIPFKLDYDRRNDPLDPRRGWAAGLGVQPFWNLYDTQTTFIKTSFASSFYHTFYSLPLSPTIALRGAIGSISGADRQEIPANERFYVGGGGSVRGYPYQTLGPITDGEPDGGLSYNEYSVETRLHWGANWGAAFFIDGGYAYKEEVPSVGEDVLWGAGLGLRYYTSFAPIRFDIAFPLDKRDEIDDDFQIYISIGQAF